MDKVKIIKKNKPIKPIKNIKGDQELPKLENNNIVYFTFKKIV